MKTTRIPILIAAALAITSAAFVGCSKKNDAISSAEQADKKEGIAAPGLEETKAIAEEGFIYGLPIVMNYTINYEFWVDKISGQYKSGFNELVNEHRVFTYEDTAVVTLNSDTPYSFACLDLRAEPFVVSVPSVEKARYFSLQFVDWNTFNYGYVGSRATGDEAGDYLVVGPDWKGETPAGIKGVLRPSTQFTIVLFRTQLFGADDMPNVIKVQDGYKIQPLSTYLKQPAPPAAPKLEFPKANKELAKTNFFEYLDFALQFAPAGSEEKEIRAKLAKIGIGPGKTQLLIKNPINRYLINSPMLPEMKKNADGSLTLYIQKDSPGEDKESNWLPAPSDPIYLVMRLYWPKTEAPSILPPGQGTWKPPGIQKAK